MAERAHDVAAGLLASHFPAAIPADVDAQIRDRFPIRLPAEAMRPAG
jgi:trimethylamine:corrinoid methyltransferase-like protein